MSPYKRISWTIFCVAVFLGGCAGAPTKQASDTQEKAVPDIITAEQLPEISGLASSILRPDALWAINDSGNRAEIIRLNTDLTVAQTVTLGIKNRDWEDLAAYSLDRQAWVVIAETGDNLRQHAEYFLYFYREETLLDAARSNLSPDKTLRFVFDDGAQDCEAIAIDTQSQQILLFSKTALGGGIYTLPLPEQAAPERQIARRVANLAMSAGLQASLVTALTGVNLDAATAAAITADGRQAFLLTYRDIWRFERGPDQSWAEALSAPPVRLAKHKLQQAEALTIDKRQRQIIVTSEQLPAPVIRIPF